mmetsp:Transcript_33379/g.53481  ORF Transcript_33379/g.53481 Transcript_33379/m.53481 type:complete len:185 (+) Transcript_33379:47-601(+)|eukprot:CAMPEP_0197040554 /NCGR_PEP_ID=MMETSP1384-20130603/17240_1 /TAXON_ID=29189 /ORGANISM="Ammonia sp." /LENGTH=184 /DNA_ID=CAMNT_0042471335 /DNA_START=43 /DNA_END=597 /DNA_ORIENTATION=-
MFALAQLMFVVTAHAKFVDDGPVYCTTGGACHCGYGGDGAILTLNRFTGDDKVYGCGGAFRLSGAEASAEWQGSSAGQSGSGSLMFSFTQDSSYDGWEGCCFICGKNLEIADMIESGWYCEKDAFSTGIWLKGLPSTESVNSLPLSHIIYIASFVVFGALCCFIGLGIGQRLTLPRREEKFLDL